MLQYLALALMLSINSQPSRLTCNVTEVSASTVTIICKNAAGFWRDDKLIDGSLILDVPVNQMPFTVKMGERMVLVRKDEHLHLERCIGPRPNGYDRLPVNYACK